MTDKSWTILRGVAAAALDDAEQRGIAVPTAGDRDDLLDMLADHYSAAFALDETRLSPRYFLRRRLRHDAASDITPHHLRLPRTAAVDEGISVGWCATTRRLAQAPRAADF